MVLLYILVNDPAPNRLYKPYLIVTNLLEFLCTCHFHFVGYPGQHKAKVAELSKFGRPVSD